MKKLIIAALASVIASTAFASGDVFQFRYKGKLPTWDSGGSEGGSGGGETEPPILAEGPDLGPQDPPEPEGEAPPVSVGAYFPNSGFESGCTGWSYCTLTDAGWPAASGVNSATQSYTSDMSQTVPIDIAPLGADVQFEFSWYQMNRDNGRVKVRLDWLNNSNTVLGTSTKEENSRHFWERKTLVGTVPTGATRYRVVFPRGYEFAGFGSYPRHDHLSMAFKSEGHTLARIGEPVSYVRQGNDDLLNWNAVDGSAVWPMARPGWVVLPSTDGSSTNNRLESVEETNFDRPRVVSGTHAFRARGNTYAPVRVYQDVSLHSVQNNVEAGGVTAEFSVYLNNTATNGSTPDGASLVIDALDKEGRVIDTAGTTVTGSQLRYWFQRFSVETAVPSQTAALRLKFNFIEVAGPSYFNVQADHFRVELTRNGHFLRSFGAPTKHPPLGSPEMQNASMTEGGGFGNWARVGSAGLIYHMTRDDGTEHVQVGNNLNVFQMLDVSDIASAIDGGGVRVWGGIEHLMLSNGVSCGARVLGSTLYERDSLVQHNFIFHDADGVEISRETGPLPLDRGLSEVLYSRVNVPAGTRTVQYHLNMASSMGAGARCNMRNVGVAFQGGGANKRFGANHPNPPAVIP